MKIFMFVLALSVSLQATYAKDGFDKPVRIGTGGAELAGCTSVGRVTPARLNVRVGPERRAAVRGRLKRGAEVFICEQEEGAGWLGIVFGASGVDCGTVESVTRPQPYSGKCRQGWVSAKYIKYIAG